MIFKSGWNHLELVGSVVDHVGIMILGSLLDDLGMTSGSFVHDFGITLGSPDDDFGIALGLFSL